MQDLARQRLDSVSFDLSRLVDFGERLVWCGPVTALSPLVREQGRLAITPQRVYFQPLHNIAGGEGRGDGGRGGGGGGGGRGGKAWVG